MTACGRGPPSAHPPAAAARFTYRFSQPHGHNAAILSGITPRDLRCRFSVQWYKLLPVGWTGGRRGRDDLIAGDGRLCARGCDPGLQGHEQEGLRKQRYGLNRDFAVCLGPRRLLYGREAQSERCRLVWIGSSGCRASALHEPGGCIRADDGPKRRSPAYGTFNSAHLDDDELHDVLQFPGSELPNGLRYSRDNLQHRDDERHGEHGLFADLLQHPSRMSNVMRAQFPFAIANLFRVVTRSHSR